MGSQLPKREQFTSSSAPQVHSGKSISSSQELDQFAQRVLDLANTLDLVEMQIKQEILDSAVQGNLDRIKQLIHRWMTGPVDQVLAHDNPSS